MLANVNSARMFGVHAILFAHSGEKQLRREYLTLLLFILFAGAQVQAQFAQPADEDIVPEANPARPTVSTPATLTPVGYLQFENGSLYATGAEEFSTQFSVNQVTKLTVAPRLQLIALTQPYAHSRTTAGAANQTGDVFGGLQGVLVAGHSSVPTIAMSYIRRLYEGAAPNVDIGSSRQQATLLVSDDLWGFHADLNGIVAEQTQGRNRRGQYGQTLSISHPFYKYKKVSVGGEIWHYSQPFLKGNAVGNLWALSYALHKNLVFDAGFDHGLTRTSTQWEGFAGFTYLLPHRLWGATK